MKIYENISELGKLCKETFIIELFSDFLNKNNVHEYRFVSFDKKLALPRNPGFFIETMSFIEADHSKLHVYVVKEEDLDKFLLMATNDEK